jgi:hypothetical protein
MNKETLKECIFQVDQTIDCSEEDINPKNMKTCSLCNKKSLLVSETKGIAIC